MSEVLRQFQKGFKWANDVLESVMSSKVENSRYQRDKGGQIPPLIFGFGSRK